MCMHCGFFTPVPATMNSAAIGNFVTLFTSNCQGMVRMRAILRRSWLVAILAVAAPLGACGQEKKDPVGQEFFITDIGQHTCADATWIAAMPAPTFMNPWGVVGMRMLASKKEVGLQKWQFD